MKTKTTISKLLSMVALVFLMGITTHASAAITVTQVQDRLVDYGVGTVSQRILEVKVNITAPDVASTVTNLQFTLTNPEQIAKVAVYNSQTSGFPDIVNSSNSFGTPIENPGATISFDGSYSCSVGSRYFLLLVDIKPTATIGTTIDATCTSATIAAVDYTSISNTNNKTAVIVDNITGIKTVGSTGDYTSLNSAITVINNLGVGLGGVTFLLADGESIAHSNCDYSYELIRQTGTATNPIVFKGSISNRPKVSLAVSGSSTDCFIGGLGVDYVTIDGIEFTATGTSATAVFERPIYFIGLPGNGCSYNEVKNCIVNAGETFTKTGCYGVSFVSNATSEAGANSYNKIYNNSISNTEVGVDFNSKDTPSFNDSNNEVYNNTINGQFNLGISLKYCTDSKIYGNTIDGTGLTTTFGNSRYGINAGSSTNKGYIDCYGNVVKNIAINAAQGLYGISLLAANVNIYNNVVANLTNIFEVTSTKSIYGLELKTDNSLIPTYNIYNNSIYLNQTATPTNTFQRTAVVGNEGTTAITSMTFINNIFVNNSITGTPANNFSLNLSGNNTRNETIGADSDNNLYFPDTNIKTKTASYSSLLDFQTALVTRELNSVSADPVFVDAALSNLSISDVLSPANNTGKLIPSVTTDITGALRSEAKPDMGAYEFDKFITLLSGSKEATTQIYSQNGQIMANLSALKGATTISVFDIKGIAVKTVNNNGAELLSIPVANKGIYLVRIQNAKTDFVKKVVIL